MEVFIIILVFVFVILIFYNFIKTKKNLENDNFNEDESFHIEKEVIEEVYKPINKKNKEARKYSKRPTRIKIMMLAIL